VGNVSSPIKRLTSLGKDGTLVVSDKTITHYQTNWHVANKVRYTGEFLGLSSRGLFIERQGRQINTIDVTAGAQLSAISFPDAQVLQAVYDEQQKKLFLALEYNRVIICDPFTGSLQQTIANHTSE